MKITKRLCRKENRGGDRDLGKIKYIIVHYTSNKTDTAKANANYFAETVVKASAHYFIDENEIYQSVEDYQIAWAVGGSKWSDCKQTGGGTMYGTVTNSNSISIELCSKNSEITEKTQANAAELIRELMKKYNVTIDRVYRHFDVNGKHCPGWSGWYGKDSSKWMAFKTRLIDEEKEYKTTKEVVDALEARGIITNRPLWLDKCVEGSNSYWLAYKLANRTKNVPRETPLKTVNDIVWELNYRDIMTDARLWLKLLNEDENLYWLAYKGANMTINKG